MKALATKPTNEFKRVQRAIYVVLDEAIHVKYGQPTIGIDLDRLVEKLAVAVSPTDSFDSSKASTKLLHDKEKDDKHDLEMMIVRLINSWDADPDGKIKVGVINEARALLRKGVEAA